MCGGLGRDREGCSPIVWSHKMWLLWSSSKGATDVLFFRGDRRHWKGCSCSPDTTLALGMWGSGWMTASRCVKGHPDTMSKVL